MISVLHIDDEQDFLDLARAFLERSGDIRIVGVTSAEQALGRLKEAGTMPSSRITRCAGMDGISLLKAYRGRRGDPSPSSSSRGGEGNRWPSKP